MSTRDKKNKGKALRLAENKEKRRANQQKKTRKVLLTVLAGAVALAIVGVGGYFAVAGAVNAYADSGAELRKTVVFKSERYTVDAAMLSFSFYDVLQSENVYENLGVRTPEELKTIYYKDENGVEDKNYSRYRYYVELAASRLESTLYFAEAAAKNGISLDAKDKAHIEGKIAAIENSAALQGKKVKDYLFSAYGRGVSLDDIRKVYELRALADKNLVYVYGSTGVSPSEIGDYLSKEDDLLYYRVDYLLYGFLYPDADAVTPEKRASDEQKAEALASCASADEFLALCRAYLLEEHAEDEDYAEDDLAKDLAACVVEGRKIEKESTSPIENWIFDFARRPGDTYKAIGQTSNGALFMVKPAYSVDTPQKAVRILMIDRKNYARVSDATAAFSDLRRLWEESDKSERAFMELVRSYSEDGLTAAADGLEEDTYSDTVFNAMISEWLKDAEKGDVMPYTSEEGMYLVYCAGQGRVRSEINAEKALRSEKYRAVTRQYITLYALTAYEENFEKIAPLVRS